MAREANDSSSGEASETLAQVNRRHVLATLAAGGAGLLAGCSSGTEDETPTQTATQTATETTPTETMTEASAQQEAIDPRFGYVGTSDSDPPVEPDHTVQAIIREREDAPLPEFYFEPVGLYAEPGDVIRFEIATPHHNVNFYHPGFGYHQRVPDMVPPASSPVLTPSDYWLYRVDAEGVYDYMCSPHELFGMVGRLVVGSATGPGATPVGEEPDNDGGGPPLRTAEFTARTVLTDDVLNPENIVDAGTVSWDDIAEENKAPPRLAPASGGEEGTPTPEYSR